MKSCAKCSNPIPSTLKVNGKVSNLANRKYCLVCSPFGLHNTRPLALRKEKADPRGDSVCTLCGRTYKHVKGSGHTKLKCNSCMANAGRFARKERCVAYKGGKCERCGYSKCLRSLTFHHRDPNAKELAISGAHCKRWDVIQKELDKCDLLCTNCHGEVHEEWDKAFVRKPAHSLTG